MCLYTVITIKLCVISIYSFTNSIIPLSFYAKKVIYIYTMMYILSTFNYNLLSVTICQLYMRIHWWILNIYA